MKYDTEVFEVPLSKRRAIMASSNDHVSYDNTTPRTAVIERPAESMSELDAAKIRKIHQLLVHMLASIDLSHVPQIQVRITHENWCVLPPQARKESSLTSRPNR